jgi:hypothetical protein
MGLVVLCAVGLGLLASSPAAAGPYSRLQVLVPGQSPAPGTPSGHTGNPLAQTAEVPFTITVRACDDQWNTDPSITHLIRILATDGSATLPSSTVLVNGEMTFTVTFNAGGNFTLFAHDETDLTIPDGASSAVSTLVIQGFEFSRINQKNQYAGVAQTITLSARGPNGQIVTGYSGTVRLQEITSFGIGRTSPEEVTLAQGVWTGGVACFRADETNINRGNVNIYAYLPANPAKNGTSDPFVVHPGTFARVQIIVPGETALPGSISGRTGQPASQAAGQAFAADVYSTDNWWNPVVSGDMVRITSSDSGMTPATGTLQNGYRRFQVALATTGTQTLTVNDQTNGNIQGMTTAAIMVIPNAAHHFEIDPIASPITAGTAVAVTIRATDQDGNTVPDFNGQAGLSANTGPGSIQPNLVSFQNGTWTGPVEFRGAGGAVALTCSDFSAPPHTGTSNSFVVEPGPFAGLQVLVPGESPRGGTPSGQEGTPSTQAAGSPFNLTVRAVDSFWNLVPGINDRIALASTDQFAGMPADTVLANGLLVMPIRLYKTGSQTIWASDVDNPAARADTSSAIPVTGGPFAKLLILAPGEESAPGAANGRSGQATDQSINYAFTVQVLATDAWWNPVGGVTDVVHLTSTDQLAQLPNDTPLVDGRADMVVRLATGGFQQLTVSDVTAPSVPGSSTQVRAITSGFHLEAEVNPTTARAGEPFTLTVRVTNDAGAVIQEINSFVTIAIQNASTQDPGRGTLLVTQFQLLQGQRSVSETYTFAESIVLIASDDAGNQPAATEPITILPGVPAEIHLTSNPTWLRGNKHATISGQLVDAFDNGVPGQAMTFSLLTGAGILSPSDSLTSATGVATADYLSGREPETSRIRADSNGLSAELDLVTALVDPNAAGGTITNYPNPFYPGVQPTTIAYKLDDAATVTLKIFSLGGDLVREEVFAPGSTGAFAGLNTFVWNGENGDGKLVASGGYIVFIEAQGGGETLHVMRRKIAAVR